MQKVDENYKLLNPAAEVRQVPKAWEVTRVEEYKNWILVDGKVLLQEHSADELDYFITTPEEGLLMRNAWRTYVEQVLIRS